MGAIRARILEVADTGAIVAERLLLATRLLGGYHSWLEICIR